MSSKTNYIQVVKVETGYFLLKVMPQICYIEKWHGYVIKTTKLISYQLSAISGIQDVQIICLNS